MTDDADAHLAIADLDDPRAFAARVIGDSMAPTFPDGSIVIFSPRADVQDGDPCFIRLRGDAQGAATFKLIYDLGDEYELRPIDPECATTRVAKLDVVSVVRAVRVILSLQSEPLK